MAKVAKKAHVALPKTKDNAEYEELPKLSEADFRIYNCLAERMDHYHNHFRQIWTTIYTSATTSQRPAGMSMRTFLRTGRNLCQHIIAHHQFEEALIYPPLAERIPAFAEHESLLEQHKEIHEGLVKVERYLRGCELGETELRMPQLKGLMDGFGEVLWEHLDQEVVDLGADVMRRFYSVEEFRENFWRMM